jgi:hypothetical protein
MTHDADDGMPFPCSLRAAGLNLESLRAKKNADSWGTGYGGDVGRAGRYAGG